MIERPDWDDYFLGIAASVAVRADCRRRRVGAVLVDADHRIIGTGYNGSYPGGPSCLAGECPRGRHYQDAEFCACGENWPCPSAVAAGSSYDTGPGTCHSIHAEGNCLLWARASAAGCAIYITDEPCGGCLRLIRGAGVKRIITPESNVLL